MSELREEILGAAINKKRIIGVILVAILLTSIFAFSTVFFNYIFGSQRELPNRNLENETEEEPLLILPPPPLDLDDLLDLLDQFDPNLLDQLDIDNESLMNMFSDLLDGNLDDLDLGDFSMGSILPILALLGLAGAGDIEIFRVYNYDSLDDMRDVLWKFECFDEYTGDGWHSTASTDIYDFYDYSDYYSKYGPDPELLTIKKPVPSPEVGGNSMVIPTLFPNPYVMDGSVNAPNLDPTYTTLYKNEYNCTVLDLYFTSSDAVNMTYEMFGLNLPTDQEINNNAVEPIYTPLYIRNKYLQLPPTIEDYKSNHPNFNTHFDNLDAIIDPSDNAFVVANKIKNYLNTYFDIPRSVDEYNPAPEGVDTVEWFCQEQVGVYSDFASAFCAFSRAFGVASRFVDGFNSFQIEEFYDNIEGQNSFAIKYENLYNWAEIYVPMDISGAGQWVQFDIEPITILGGNYNITVDSDQLYYSRPDTAIITANVSSLTSPEEGLTITFTDTTTGQNLGQDITDINGEASILFDLNDSHVVGPHVIEAKYDDVNSNTTVIGILGDISVLLINVNPAEINISDSQPDSTNIQGHVYDPKNGESVQNAVVNLLLFQRGTSTEETFAFNPSSVITDNNGDFNEVIDLNPSVLVGQYEVRADFNGTWILYVEPYLYQIPSMSNSSNRMGLNVTKSLDISFYIDGIPAVNPTNPLVNRSDTLTLTARVVSVVHGPMYNKRVYFYDYSRGDVLINSDLTDINGYASTSYFVGDYCVAGPNLLYARIGLQKNYSYFVLNETPTINIISGPTPRVINRTGSGVTQFNIVGEIYDTTTNSLPIRYSEITLTLLRGGINYSSYLVPNEAYPYQTDASGNFDLTFGVDSNTPPGNYTLRLDFNGTINLLSYPYPYYFDLPILTTTSYFINDLRIETEASLLFWINGTTSDNFNNPRINRNEDLNLSVYIHLAGVPIDDGERVDFYDVTQNIPIGYDTTINGIATVIYSTNSSTVAGPHLIYATWNGRTNYSYFVLDESIDINLQAWPQPREINKYGPSSNTFIIQGYLNDTSNFDPIKYGEISIHIFDGTEIFGGLVLVSGSYQTDQYGTIYAEFTTASFVPTGNYTLEVWFNGTFIYSSPNNIYNEHDFNLPYINASSDANYQLRVYDPDDIKIHLWINGTATLPTYYDWEGNFPESFSRGGDINFTVYILNSTDNPVTYGEVRIYNIYNNSYLLGSHTFTGGESRQGFHTFIIDTSLWYGGIHYIKVNWSSYVTFNTTFVIINEPVTISTNLIDRIITRDVENFFVSGTVQDQLIGTPLRGLRLNIILLDSSLSDVTLSYLIGSNWLTINNDGSYQFSNSIALSCPQGEYSLNITFTGDIDAPGIYQTGIMIHSSSLIPINITAGTSLITDTYWSDWESYDPELWILGDTVHINGTLLWDNGTAIEGVNVIVSVRYLSNGTWIDANSFVVTGPGGIFEGILTVDDEWPDTRAETTVWVNYSPPVSEYIEGDEEPYL
ncbi:MAG: transglutaminase-like domain-containing protein [Promethearchaeota archaeon]